MILILASDVDDREALIDLLESEGYRTRPVASEREACAAMMGPAEALLVSVQPETITLYGKRGATTLRRPFAPQALLTRVVGALATELGARFSPQPPLALAS